MDELDLGTDLDYKDLGDNARKNDRTGMIQIIYGLHPSYEICQLQSWTWDSLYLIESNTKRSFENHPEWCRKQVPWSTIGPSRRSRLSRDFSITQNPKEKTNGHQRSD